MDLKIIYDWIRETMFKWPETIPDDEDYLVF